LRLSDRASASTSSLEASERKAASFNLGLQRLFWTGGTAAVNFLNSRNESNSTFENPNPSYRSDIEVGFTQPILRDYGRLVTERNVLVARANSQTSRENFERSLTDAVKAVSDAYWRVVETGEQLRVAEQSLDLAKELHERNKIQVDVGTLAPLELVQSEAAIATREEEIIRAQSAVGDAEDALRRLINVPAGPTWETPIRTITKAETERLEIDVLQAIDKALASRPELRAQRSTLERLKIDKAFAKNQLLPTLDFNVTYGFNGVGGTQNLREDPTDPSRLTGRISGGYDDALRQIGNLDFDGWSARFTFGLPIQNRAAKAQAVIANLALEQGGVQLEDLQAGIITEVRTAARAVETAAKQIDAARSSVNFQQRNLDAERKRYENGMSTSYRINQIQDDLTRARSREVSAIVNYRTSITAFQRAIGELLTANGVTIDDPSQDPTAAEGFAPVASAN
jgi:outer membrane protein